MKGPIIWTEVETEIGQERDGWSDIGFEMCHEVKITAKSIGKNTNVTATKIMFGNSKQKSSEKLNFKDEDESNNIQTYKSVKAELQEEKSQKVETVVEKKVEQPVQQSKPVETKKTEQKSGELGQLEQLEALADLLNRGVLTKQEFDFKKKKILGL